MQDSVITTEILFRILYNVYRDSNLLKVIPTLHEPRRAASTLHGGQEQGHQQTDHSK